MRWLVRMFFRMSRLVLAPVMPSQKVDVVVRSAEEQQRVDEQTSRLALYQFNSCPFCRKVRGEIARLSLDIALHDTRTDPQRRRELRSGGGKTMVPCLRITNDDGSIIWMYESADIIGYLQQRFAQAV